MNKTINEIIRSHLVLGILSVIAVLVLMSGVTYSLFQTEHKNTNNQIVNVGNLDIDLSSTSGSILLENLSPKKNEDIKVNDNRYNFTITNTGDYDIIYSIYLNDNTTEFLKTNTKYSSYKPMTVDNYSGINYRVDSSFIINSLNQVYDANTKRINVLQGTLAPGEKEDHYIQFWLNNTSKNDLIGSILALNINMEATANKYGTIALNEVTVDGTKENNLPANVEGVFDCNNANATWDYTLGGLKINNLSDNTICKANLNTPTNTNYLNQHIINLSKEAVGTNGGVVHETFTDTDGSIVDTGYRYEGKDPNNYVWFNNEIWRIIGVFDTKLENGKIEKLTKLIRDEPVGNYIYGDNNSWESINGTKSILNNILNKNYYNSTDGTYEPYCLHTVEIKGNCNFINTGLKSTSIKKLEYVNWNLGICDSSEVNVIDMYKAERGNTYSSNTKKNSIGLIGLMYPSDYGFASLSSSCDRNISMASYNSQNCAGNNWLFHIGYEYTISTTSLNTNKILSISNKGRIFTTDSNLALPARPVVYLKSNTILMNGNGTTDSPYNLN